MSVIPLKPVKRQLQFEDKLLSIFDHLSIGVLLMNFDGKVEFVNPALKRLLQVRVTNPTGRHYSEIIWIAALHRIIDKVLMSSDEVASEEFEIDQGGTETWISARVERWTDADNALLVVEDVTSRKKLEATRRDFVANVSHELRTPMTVICGFVETLLGSETIREDEDRKFLLSIGRQANRINTLCEDLLSLSRLEASGSLSSMVMDSFSLKELFSEISAEMAPICEAAAIEFSVALEDDLFVHGHSGLIYQAVVNLLKNSIAFTPAEGKIEIAGSRVGRDICIKVVDTGCGIATPELDRIFERFYKIDHARTRKCGGSGLGLAIVKHIALVHGGSVQVASELGKGSSFSLLLKSGEKKITENMETI